MVGHTAAEVDNRVVAVVEVCLRRVVDHTVEVDNRVVAVAEVFPLVVAACDAPFLYKTTHKMLIN